MFSYFGRGGAWSGRASVLGGAVIIVAAVLIGPQVGRGDAAFPGRNGKIAFSCGGICVVDADGSLLRQLTTNHDDLEPSWSPDGRTIVFQRGDHSVGGSHYQEGELMLVNVDGTGLRQLTNSEELLKSYPHFSADGTKIVFSARSCTNDVCTPNDLYTVDASDGGSLARVTSDAFAFAPAWSSTGRLAWESSKDRHLTVDRSPEHEIYVDGVNITNEVPCPSDESREETCTSDDRAPEWAPDGSYLIFTRYVEGEESTIMRVDPDGTDLLPLVQGEFPAISPDGTKLAYSRYGATYVANVDGTERVRILRYLAAYLGNWGEFVPPIKHQREVTFRIKAHGATWTSVPVTGTVTTEDGYGWCVDSVPVTIQRKEGTRWVTSKTVETGEGQGGSSSFSTRVVHYETKFRAVIERQVNVIDECSRAVSPVRTDPHGFVSEPPPF